MSAKQNNVVDFGQIWTISLMADDIAAVSHRPGAEILKMASHEPIMQSSIIDCFGETEDWL